METLTTLATPQEESERAPLVTTGGGVVGSPGTCPICGTALTGRQKSACSAKCRAALSRRLHIPVRRERLLEIRALLKRTLEETYQAKGKIDRYLGG
jgi:predicted nucleic acid-binding Zn ribbon protein